MRVSEKKRIGIDCTCVKRAFRRSRITNWPTEAVSHAWARPMPPLMIGTTTISAAYRASRPRSRCGIASSMRSFSRYGFASPRTLEPRIAAPMTASRPRYGPKKRAARRSNGSAAPAGLVGPTASPPNMWPPRPGPIPPLTCAPNRAASSGARVLWAWRDSSPPSARSLNPLPPGHRFWHGPAKDGCSREHS